MSKLTKMEHKLHKQACDILLKDNLTYDEKWFVAENWHEGATHEQGFAGAYFTPLPIARGVAMHASGQRRVIDICAGIGTLAFALHEWTGWHNVRPEIVCVERNPDYIAVGKKILPEATWIEADVFDLPSDLTGFDCAISNPPFGRVRTAPAGLKHSAEYEVIRVASQIAAFGVFVLPAGSVPFSIGQDWHNEFDIECAKYEKFLADTGIVLEPNCGIMTVGEGIKWRGVKIATEIALAEFANLRASSKEDDEIEITDSVESFYDDLPLFAALRQAA